MIDPFRLRVLKALSATIEQVNPDNPNGPESNGGKYEFDLRNSVFRGRVIYDKDDPLPMVSILEAPIPEEVALTRGAVDGSTGQWKLIVQGFCKDDFENPTDPAHSLMGEVKSILTKEKLKRTNKLGMGSRVAEIFIGQGTVRPPDDANDKAFFWLTLTLVIGEKLEDPYH